MADAERILWELLARPFPAPDAYSYSPLIGAHCAAGAVARAHALLTDMRQRNVPRNAVVYSALMSGYARDGQVAAVEQLWAEMKTDKIRATRHTCNALIGEWLCGVVGCGVM